MLTKYFTVILLLIAFGMAGNQAVADGANLSEDTVLLDNSFYQSGVEAFRQQRFDDAILLFKQAQAEGDESGQVQYNIAVSHYQLGDFDAARTAFSTLIEDDELGWWAKYNLALIDERQQLFAAAERGYLQVASSTADSELANRAAAKLQGLDSGTVAKDNTKQSSWLGSVAVGAGYDDNVIDPQDTAGSEQGDEYYESLLSLSNTWGKTPGVRWHLDALGYASRYAEVDEYDVNLANLALSSSFKVASWKMKTGISGEYSSVGDNGFLQTMAFNVSGRYAAAEQGVLKLAYRFSDFTSLADQYDQLGGNAHRLTAQYTWLISDAFYWQLRYRLTVEDRADLEQVDSFSSYSPIRNGLRVRGVWRPSDWEYALSLGLRDSQYQDDNHFSDASVEQRQDMRLTAAVSALYQWSENWSANIEFNYTDNESTINDFDYQRSSVIGGISWSF